MPPAADLVSQPSALSRCSIASLEYSSSSMIRTRGLRFSIALISLPSRSHKADLQALLRALLHIFFSLLTPSVGKQGRRHCQSSFVICHLSFVICSLSS